VRKIGYIGTKRYVRVTLTPTGNSATLPAYISGVAILGHPRTGRSPARPKRNRQAAP
jgi:hypothetical protein